MQNKKRLGVAIVSGERSFVGYVEDLNKESKTVVLSKAWAFMAPTQYAKDSRSGMIVDGFTVPVVTPIHFSMGGMGEDLEVNYEAFYYPNEENTGYFEKMIGHKDAEMVEARSGIVTGDKAMAAGQMSLGLGK